MNSPSGVLAGAGLSTRQNHAVGRRGNEQQPCEEGTSASMAAEKRVQLAAQVHPVPQAPEREAEDKEDAVPSRTGRGGDGLRCVKTSRNLRNARHVRGRTRERGGTDVLQQQGNYKAA